MVTKLVSFSEQRDAVQRGMEREPSVCTPVSSRKVLGRGVRGWQQEGRLVLCPEGLGEQSGAELLRMQLLPQHLWGGWSIPSPGTRKRGKIRQRSLFSASVWRGSDRTSQPSYKYKPESRKLQSALI